MKTTIKFLSSSFVGKWHNKMTLWGIKFEWDLFYIYNGSLWNHVLIHEENEMIYLYAQDDIWVNEKLILNMHPMSWKIKRKYLKQS